MQAVSNADSSALCWKREDIGPSRCIPILNLEKRLAEGEYLAVILDIDTVPVDNRTIRELTIKYPGVHLLLCLPTGFIAI